MPAASDRQRIFAIFQGADGLLHDHQFGLFLDDMVLKKLEKLRQAHTSPHEPHEKVYDGNRATMLWLFGVGSMADIPEESLGWMLDQYNKWKD